MAANEPKVTKLKPGEGAGDFRPKQGGGGAKRGTPGGQGRTENPCILKDGSVDPQCKKVYQRSVAGRQTLAQFIKEKSAQGMTEKDIFMAAVNGLMSRRLGYVGAYLDSKNPGRTYNKNQAMKIADAVMSKEGVGDNPGARLTGPSGGGRQRGKSQEKGKAGASVRQQRKQPGGRGGGMGMPETWAKPGAEAPSSPVEKPSPAKNKPVAAPKTEVQKTLEAIKSGKLSKEDLAKMLEERRGGGERATSAPPLPGSAAAAKRDKSIEVQKAKTEEEKKERPAPPAKTIEQPEEPISPEEEKEVGEEGRLRASDEQITNLFRNVYNQYKQSALQQATYDARKFKRPVPKPSEIQLSDEEVADAAQETIDQLSEEFDIDRNSAIQAINKKYGLDINSGGKEPLPTEKEEVQEERVEEEGGKGGDRMRPSEDQVTSLFRNLYNQYKQSALQQATYDARKFGRTAPKLSDIQLSDEEVSDAAQEALDQLSEEFEVDRDASIQAINKKFGLKIPTSAEEGKGEEEEETPPQAPAEEKPQGEVKRAVTSKGGFKAPAQIRRPGGGEGFTPSPKTVRDVKSAAAQSPTLQDFKTYLYNKQPSLFGKRGFETPESTSAPGAAPDPQSVQEPATVGRGQEGQQTFFKTKGGQMTDELRADLTKKPKAPSPSPKPPTETTSQVPLRLGGDATQAKMKQQQAVAGRREERMTKEVEKGVSASSKKRNFTWVPDPNDPTKGEWVRKAKGRKTKPPAQLGLPFNTGEMSYEEFAQSVRSMMR